MRWAQAPVLRQTREQVQSEDRTPAGGILVPIDFPHPDWPLMSTKDLEKATGMSAGNWLRWCRKGIIPPPNRGHSTSRRYTKRHFEQIVAWFEDSVVLFQGRRSSGKRWTYRVVKPFGEWREPRLLS